MCSPSMSSFKLYLLGGAEGGTRRLTQAGQASPTDPQPSHPVWTLWQSLPSGWPGTVKEEWARALPSCSWPPRAGEQREVHAVKGKGVGVGWRSRKDVDGGRGTLGRPLDGLVRDGLLEKMLSDLRPKVRAPHTRTRGRAFFRTEGLTDGG